MARSGYDLNRASSSPESHPELREKGTVTRERRWFPSIQTDSTATLDPCKYRRSTPGWDAPPWSGGVTRSLPKRYPWLDTDQGEPELEAFLMANWQGGIEVRRSYSTSIVVGKDEDEVRRGLMDRPALTFTVPYTALKEGDLGHLEALFIRAGNRKFRVPLYTDFASITADVSSGATTIPVSSTLYKRLRSSGQLVALCRRDGTRWRFEPARLASDSSETALYLSGPISGSFPAGSRVFPLVLCEMILQNELLPISDSHGQAGMIFKEVVGESAVKPALPAGDSLSEFQSYAGLPILTSVPHDWNGVSVRNQRTGTFTPLGRGNVLEDLGPIIRRKINLSFTCLSREASWKLIRFFDYAKGRLNPFWIASPINDFRGFSYDGSKISILKTNMPRDVVAEHSYVCFLMRNGVSAITPITSVDEDGGYIRVSVENPPAGITADVRRISWAYLARLDSDEMTESWVTDKIMTTSFSCSEIKVDVASDEELSPATPDFTIPGTGSPALPTWSPDNDCFETSGVVLPMFQTPCLSCDPDRPAMLGAAVEMPKRIKVAFKGGEFRFLSSFLERDNRANFPAGFSGFGVYFPKILARLQTEWILEYDAAYGTTTGFSRHPHHLRLNSSGVLSFPSNSGVSCNKRRWKQTVNIMQGAWSRQMDVILQSETPVNATEGSHGTVFHLYVFLKDLFQVYVDGATYVNAQYSAAYSYDDPVVVQNDFLQVPTFHPHLLVHGTVPTTMEAPCEYAWHYPHETVSPVAWGTGMPFSLYGQNNTVLPSTTLFQRVGQTTRACMTIGGSCDKTNLFPYLALHPSLGILPIVPTNLGVRDSALLGPGAPINRISDSSADGGLTYLSSASLEVCSVPVASISCCPSLSCWKADPGTFFNSMDCCFPVDQSIDLTVTQYCNQVIRTYDSGGVGIEDNIRATPVSVVHTLIPRRCSYTAGALYFEWYKVMPDNAQIVLRLEAAGWRLYDETNTLTHTIPSSAWPQNAVENAACVNDSLGRCDPLDPNYRQDVACSRNSAWSPAVGEVVDGTAIGFTCGPDGVSPLGDPGSPTTVADQVILSVTMKQCGTESSVLCCQGYAVWFRSDYSSSFFD